MSKAYMPGYLNLEPKTYPKLANLLAQQNMWITSHCITGTHNQYMLAGEFLRLTHRTDDLEVGLKFLIENYDEMPEGAYHSLRVMCISIGCLLLRAKKIWPEAPLILHLDAMKKARPRRKAFA